MRSVPRSKAKRGTREKSSSQSNSVPMFYQLSKQCLPGLEKCHTLLSQSNRCYLYPCQLLVLLREDKTLRFQTFLLPNSRGYPVLSRESKAKQRALSWGWHSPHSLAPDHFWPDPKAQKTSGHLKLNENFNHVAPGLPPSMTEAWLAPPKEPHKKYPNLLCPNKDLQLPVFT